LEVFNYFHARNFTTDSHPFANNCGKFHINQVTHMVLKMQLRRLRASAASCLRDDKGNVAIIFALTLLPIIGFIGAAIDYSRANHLRSAMQAAIDSTTLMLAKDAASLTPAQLTQKANAYFNALYTHPEVANIAITATYTANGPDGTTVKVDGSGSIATTFMKVVGYPNLPFSSTSTATWGSGRMRVALALDTTGSMASDGKMNALKPAAKSLIDQLAALAKTPGDVYVSIIPFVKDVNVGTSNVNATWLKWSVPGNGSDAWDQNNGTCSGGNNGKGKGKGKGGGGSYNNEFTCTQAGRTWTPANHNTWTGCVMDRDQDYDLQNTLPTTEAAKFLPQQYSSCPSAPIMPLTYDWTALKNRIDLLNPSGNTNQAIGLAWAWQTLSAGPFTYPAEEANYQYSKAIVLMSDGLNTQNRWTTSQTQIDNRQRALCSNVKAAGITIYTIHVNTDGDPTSQVLRDCASSPDKFFTLTSANQMMSVFTQIGTSLSKLRLSK
jgi:Flp pilus assembly protein TadG